MTNHVGNKFKNLKRIIQDFLNEDFKEQFLRAFKHGSLENILTLEKLQIDYSDSKNIANDQMKSSVKTLKKENVVILNNLNNSQIFVKGTPDFLFIKKCKNCDVFVEGVQKLTLVENSMEINFCAITKLININNVTDSKINFYSEFSPNLLGEIKKVELGPHNANFDTIFEVTEKLGMKVSKNSVNIFTDPWIFFNI